MWTLQSEKPLATLKNTLFFTTHSHGSLLATFGRADALVERAPKLGGIHPLASRRCIRKWPLASNWIPNIWKTFRRLYVFSCYIHFQTISNMFWQLDARISHYCGQAKIAAVNNVIGYGILTATSGNASNIWWCLITSDWVWSRSDLTYPSWSDVR